MSMNTPSGGTTVHAYPSPDLAHSGPLGYLCAVCGAEEICARHALPTGGFILTAMTKGAHPRMVWLCSLVCLREHAATL